MRCRQDPGHTAARPARHRTQAGVLSRVRQLFQRGGQVRRCSAAAAHLRVAAPASPAGSGAAADRPADRTTPVVAVGCDNSAIAKRLVLSRDTVRKHLENAYARLGVSSRTAAVARAFPDITWS